MLEDATSKLGTGTWINLKFLGQGFGEVDDRSLARSIIGLASIAKHADDAAHVHDATTPLFQHGAHHCFCHVEHAFHVGVHNCIEIRFAHGHEQLVLCDSGVVHRHIQLASSVHHFVQSRLCCIEVARIALDG